MRKTQATTGVSHDTAPAREEGDNPRRNWKPHSGSPRVSRTACANRVSSRTFLSAFISPSSSKSQQPKKSQDKNASAFPENTEVPDHSLPQVIDSRLDACIHQGKSSPAVVPIHHTAGNATKPVLIKCVYRHHLEYIWSGVLHYCQTRHQENSEATC